MIQCHKVGSNKIKWELTRIKRKCKTKAIHRVRQWRNFSASWISPPCCFLCDIAEMRMLCWQASDHIHILTNQRIEYYWNNTINFSPLNFTHYVRQVIPTKWRSYRGHKFCDVTMCRPTADIKLKQQTLSWWQKCVSLIKAIIVNAFKQLLNRRDREKLFTGRYPVKQQLVTTAHT